MTGPRSRVLPDGRLHLHHGPIDLVISAEGQGRDAALRAATQRFDTILEELVAELPLLRRPTRDTPQGPTARRMFAATLPHRPVFLTPMASVAGAVADEILSHMLHAAPLTRAHVNNGGDIALHLAPGQSYTTAICTLNGTERARIRLTAEDGINGIATSGFGGRSHTLGIADSVTVLAATAAEADAAATLIANAVNLPDHPAITRRPASDLSPDSDLGHRLVTTAVGPLTPEDIAQALANGQRIAERMRRNNLIHAAALLLRGAIRLTGSPEIIAPKALDHA